MTVPVRAATANVKTLDPAGIRRAVKLGLNTSSKIEFLDLSFHNSSYDVIGIQESYVQGSVTRDQPNYTVSTSGALADGSLGVESWAHKRLLQGARVRPRALGPRLLSVFVDTPTFSFVHVVAHAPCNDAPEDERTKFWDFLRQELGHVGIRRNVVLCIDGNATMGSVESPAIPCVDPTIKNANGFQLRVALEEFLLYASSMNTAVPLPTWFGGRRQHEGRRIDYVCVSQSLAPECDEAGTDTTVHLSGKDSICHVMAYTCLRLPLRAAPSPGDRPTSRLSRALVNDPSTQLVFQNFLWQRLAATLAGDPSPEALHDRVLALMNAALTAGFHTPTVTSSQAVDLISHCRGCNAYAPTTFCPSSATPCLSHATSCMCVV